MEIILIQEVPSLGKRGEVVKVNPGYARNFLFPKKLAVEYSEKTLKKFKEEEKIKQITIEKEIKNIKQLKEEISELTLVIKAKSGKTGKLFGSITQQDISDEMLKQHSIQIDKKDIIISQPIKSIGIHQVLIKLPKGFEANLRLEVI